MSENCRKAVILGLVLAAVLWEFQQTVVMYRILDLEKTRLQAPAPTHPMLTEAWTRGWLEGWDGCWKLSAPIRIDVK